MNPKIERVRLDRIQIGRRRRQKLGSIAALAKEIDDHGLLHPIIVTDDLELVCGERRLKAAERLGWKSIPARRWGSLSWDEIRALELAENVQRLDLSTYDQSREMIQAGEAETGEKLATESPVSKGGRGKAGGNRKAAAALGVSKDTIRKARKHVEAGEAYPFLQQHGWNQSQALDSRDRLDKMAKADRETICQLVSEPGVPPKTQRTIIHVASEMPAEKRHDTLKLYRSGKPEKVSLAKTRLAQLPPPPPHRLALLRKAIRCVEQTLDDSLRAGTGDLRSALSSLKSALKISEEDYQKIKEREGF